MMKRMQEIDEQKGTKYIVGEIPEEGGGDAGGLAQVPETLEWAEQSPKGSPKNKE